MFYSATSKDTVSMVTAPFHVNSDREYIKSRLSSLSEENLNDILSYAEANTVLLLLSDQWKTMDCLCYLPSIISEKLTDMLDQEEKKAYEIHQEIIEVISSINDIGIPCITLKGAVLNGLLYKKPGLRLMRDLDIYAEKDSANKIYELLRKKDFFPVLKDKKTEHHIPRLVRNRNDNSQFAVEIHTALVPSRVYGIRVEKISSLWENSIWVELNNGFKVRSLSYNDIVLHLHIHLFHHIFYNFRLMHLLDIVFIVRLWKDLINWENISKHLDILGLAQFKNDLWNIIRIYFGDILTPNINNMQKKSNFGDHLLIHGSIPIFSSFRYTKDLQEIIRVLMAELYRYRFRSQLSQWGYLKRG